MAAENENGTEAEGGAGAGAVESTVTYEQLADLETEFDDVDLQLREWCFFTLEAASVCVSFFSILIFFFGWRGRCWNYMIFSVRVGSTISDSIQFNYGFVQCF